MYVQNAHMAPAPIVIKCECGVETRGRSGDVITCTGCGLKYDTGAESKMLEMVAGRTQRQFKYLSRAGIGLIGILGLAGLAKFGTYGLVGGALIGAVLWYVLFMPWQKRRMLRKATELYTPTVAPTRK